MADAVDFPDCCGLIILNRFRGGHPNSDPDDCMSETVCNTFLKTKEQAYYGKRAGLLAVLSEPQFDRIGDVFHKRKWSLKLDGTVNPRTGAKIFMFFRDLNPTTARKKRIFGNNEE